MNETAKHYSQLAGEIQKVITRVQHMEGEDTAKRASRWKPTCAWRAPKRPRRPKRSRNGRCRRNRRACSRQEAAMPHEPIHFREENGRVTLEMSVEDWEALLLLLGIANGPNIGKDWPSFYRVLQFANRLNAENPRFRPFEIPEEYRDAS